MTLTEERPASGSATARRAMIDSQLRTSGVNEPWVLAAMMRLAREDFVPAAARAAAYTDRAVPLGDGRFLAAPLVHARMLAEAAPKPGEKVLLVGDAAGYLAALLGPECDVLDVIDPARAAAEAGAGAYDLVVVDGAVEQVPTGLAAQLAEGGRLVAGLLERGVTRLVTGRKVAGAVALLPVTDIGIPVLAEFAAPKRWSF